MELTEVRDYIKANSGIEAFYSIGRVNLREEKCIGVYPGGRDTAYMKDVGAEIIHKKSISVLVHWTNDAAETEIAAQKLFDFLEKSQNGTQIGNNVVAYLKMLECEPIDVSVDEFGHYERVINFIIYYTKK